MKKLALSTLLIFALATPVLAADEKIDPDSYICAELIAASIDGQPPLFEGLQLDGFAAATQNQTVADPDSMQDLLIVVSDSCSSKPAEKAIKHWRAARKGLPYADDGQWRADRVTCGDYAANPDDASGFVIWLDGYQRGKSGKKTSVFESQDTLDKFLEACQAAPDRLMIDVMQEYAK